MPAPNNQETTVDSLVSKPPGGGGVQFTMRLTGLSLGYGAAAGAFAGIAFAAMNGIQHLSWDERDQRWYIFGIIMIGAVLIAVTGQFLRRIDSSAADETFDQQLDSLQNTKPRTHTNLLLIAILAIIAVAFGGAIGPEAGLVSIVAELSLLVSGVLARSTAEQRLIMESGTAASLAGVYSSPPGAAAFEDDQLTTPKVYTLLAAVAGFVGFFSVNSIFSDGGGLRLHVPAEIVQVDEYAVLLALLPAITAALVSLVYVEFSHQLSLMLGKWGKPVVQTLALSAIFALIAAFYPGVRFRDTMISGISLSLPIPPIGARC